MCQNTTAADAASTYRSQGHLINHSTTNAIRYTCPVIANYERGPFASARQYPASIWGVRVWVIDAHPTENVDCTLTVHNVEAASANSVITVAKQSTGWEPKPQGLYLEIPSGSQIDWDYYYVVECTLPPTWQGTPSRLTAYTTRYHG